MIEMNFVMVDDDIANSKKGEKMAPSFDGEIETWFDDLEKIVCPYCGEDCPQDEAGYCWYRDEYPIEVKCLACFKTFEVCCRCSWSYETSKRREDNDEK